VGSCTSNADQTNAGGPHPHLLLPAAPQAVRLPGWQQPHPLPSFCRPGVVLPTQPPDAHPLLLTQHAWHPERSTAHALATAGDTQIYVTAQHMSAQPSSPFTTHHHTVKLCNKQPSRTCKSLQGYNQYKACVCAAHPKCAHFGCAHVIKCTSCCSHGQHRLLHMLQAKICMVLWLLTGWPVRREMRCCDCRSHSVRVDPPSSSRLPSVQAAAAGNKQHTSCQTHTHTLTRYTGQPIWWHIHAYVQRLHKSAG
jgi:hypothetical protein